MNKKVTRKIAMGLLTVSILAVTPIGQSKTAEASLVGDVLDSVIGSVSKGKAIKRNSATPIDKILHEAVKANDYDMAVKALEQGAKVNSMYDDALPLQHALYYVSDRHDTRIADLLIEHGADIEGWYDSNRRHIYAFMLGSRDVIKYLMDKGLNINIKGNGNKSLLMQALGLYPWQGNISRYELMQEIVNKGADVNVRASENTGEYMPGEAALHYAAKNNDIEAAKILLYAGANKNIRNSAGKTPLDLAIEYHHTEMVKFLMNWQ